MGVARIALAYAGAGVRVWWVEIGQVNEDTIALLEEALAALPELDSALRAQLLVCLGAELHFVHDAAERRDHLSAEGLAMARRLGDRAVLAYALVTRNLAVIGPDTVDERRANTDEVLALAATDIERVAGLYHRLCVLNETGEFSAATDALEQAIAISERMKDSVLTGTLHQCRAMVEVCEGRFDAADARAYAGFLLTQEARDRNAIGFFGAMAAWSLRYRGRGDEVRELAPIGEVVVPAIRPTFLAIGALLAADASDVDEARRLIAGVDVDDVPRDAAYVATLAILGLAAAGASDARCAQRCYDALLPYELATLTSIPVTLGSVGHVLGATALATGRHDDAIAHLEQNIDRCRSAGWRTSVVESQCVLAAAHLARGLDGDRERASTIAAEALAAADDLGAALFSMRAGAVLAEASGERPGATRAASASTRRDRAKTRLVAGGRRALRRVASGWTDEEIVRRFGSLSAQRAIFAAMSRSFRPSRAFGFEGSIQFEIRLPSVDADPLPADYWTIDVRGRRATARRERCADPAVSIALELPVLVRMATGERHPVEAMADGEIVVVGDVILGARLTDMFGMAVDLDTVAG